MSFLAQHFAMWKLPQNIYYYFSISGSIFSISSLWNKVKIAVCVTCICIYENVKQNHCLHSVLPFKSLTNLKKWHFTQQQKAAMSECNVTVRTASLKHYMVFQD